MEREKPLETDYMRALLARAPLSFPEWRLFRRPAGGTIRLRSGDFIRSGVAGQADVQAIRKGGMSAEIEAKNVGGKLTEAQERWRAWCVEWGVPHVVLRVQKGEVSVETVERWIAELRHFFSTF